MPSKLTKKEIIAELENAGIDFDKNALKADLEKIYEDRVLNAPEEIVEEIEEEEPTTPKIIDSPMLPEKTIKTENEPENVPEFKPAKSKPSENLSWEAKRQKLLNHRDMFVRRQARNIKKKEDIEDLYKKIYC